MADDALVSYIRPELSRKLIAYYLIRDCIEGELAIKGIVNHDIEMFGIGTPVAANPSTMWSSQINLGFAKRYLPQPNATDQSQDNLDRYRSYVLRAVFYNATGRTLSGFTGQIFARDPDINLPPRLTVLNKNADGQGVGLIDLTKRAVRTVLPYGRCGLLVDYPTTKNPDGSNNVTTIKQLQDGDIQPVITVYQPWNVINWRTKKRGARTVLSLVVLREWSDNDDDNFQLTAQLQYRVLRLQGNTYVQEIYSDNGNKRFDQKETVTPQDANGNPLNEIPFKFIGAENNDALMDNCPFYDLASLNVAHYRNSADYEESCFVVGQPTPVLAGLTESWVKDVLKGQVQLGSRAAIPLPQGATAELLQVEPNTITLGAMEHKERQMVALGAQIVQQAQVQRTATESIMEVSSENSVLTDVAKNVSTAFEWALGVAAQFTGDVATDIKCQLNTEFELNKLSSDDQAKLVAAWQRGAITFSEMRAVLRKTGTASLPDDEALAQLQKEQAVMAAIGPLADPFGSTTPAAGGGGTPPANPNPTRDPKGHAKVAAGAK